MQVRKITFVLFAFLISLTTIGQQQMENPGFEFWEEIGFGPDTIEPVGWNSLKSSDGGFLINSVIPVTLMQSTDAHSGMYSVMLKNDTILGMVAPGTLTNGRVHATLPPSDAYVYTIDSLSEFSTPFTDKPDSIAVWAKFLPASGDIGHLVAVLHTDTAKIADPLQTDWVAVATIDFTEETTEWTKFSAPFVYLNDDTPEYILFAIYAGDAANSLLGSTLYLDDIEMIYNQTGIQPNAKNDVKLYSADNQLFVEWNDINNPVLKLHNIFGQTVLKQKLLPHTKNAFQINVPSGIYIYEIKGTSSDYTGKVFIK